MRLLCIVVLIGAQALAQTYFPPSKSGGSVTVVGTITGTPPVAYPTLPSSPITIAGGNAVCIPSSSGSGCGGAGIGTILGAHNQGAYPTVSCRDASANVSSCGIQIDPGLSNVGHVTGFNAGDVIVQYTSGTPAMVVVSGAPGYATTPPAGLVANPPFVISNINNAANSLSLLGNTTVPPPTCSPSPCSSLPPVGYVGDLGFNAATGPSYYKQWPTSAGGTPGLVLGGAINIPVTFTNGSAEITGANSLPVGASVQLVAGTGGTIPTSHNACTAQCFVSSAGLSGTQFELYTTYAGAISGMALTANSNGAAPVNATSDIVPMSFAQTLPFALGLNLSGGALPTPQTGTVLQLSNAPGTPPAIELDSYGAQGSFDCNRSDGTIGSTTALLSGETICAMAAFGQKDANGNVSGAQAGWFLITSQNWYNQTLGGTFAAGAVTGGTVTGTGTCTATTANGGGTGGTATVTVTAGAVSGNLTITAVGSGYTGVPSSWTLAAPATGSASCTGSPTLATTGGSISGQGARASAYTTANDTSSLVEQFRVSNDGGILAGFTSYAGHDKGQGTINVLNGYYINDVQWGPSVTNNFTSVQNFNLGAIGATGTDALQLYNTAAATAGTTVQLSPEIHLRGAAWTTNAGGSSQLADWLIYNAPVTGSGATITSQLNFGESLNGGGYTTVANISSAGALTTNGAVLSGASVQAASASTFRWGAAGSGRDIISSAANGSLTITDTSGSASGFTATVTGDDFLCYSPTTFILHQGTTSICGTSLARYKTNILNLEHGLDYVMRYRPVTFDWRSDLPQCTTGVDGDCSDYKPRPVLGMRDVGLIADEVAAVDPLLGVYRDNGDLYNFRDRAVLTTVIKAVQELKKENDELRSRIAALERQ